MNLYEAIMFGLGWVWVTLMLARVPIACYDARTFYRAFKALGYKGNIRWMVVARVWMPTVLAAPTSLWMQPRDFFSRVNALEAYDAAQQLIFFFDNPEDEDDESEKVGPVDMQDLIMAPRTFKPSGDDQ